MSSVVSAINPALAAKDCVSLNELEHFLASCPKPPDCRVEHRFTPDLYSRTIYMPKGLLCTSKIHRTEHQYVVSKGHLKVWIDGKGWEEISAPYIGITKPGARRALWIMEDTIWTTFHPTCLTDVAMIEKEIIEPHFIPKHREEIP